MYSTKTGTDGSYTFPIVADGAYKVKINNYGVHLQAWYPDKTSHTQASVLNVEIGTNITADQAMTPGHVLSGTLTSSTGGTPVSGATVRVQGGGVDYHAISDANGQYAVTGMVPGNRTVSIYAFGHDPLTVGASIPAVTTLNQVLTASATSTGAKGTITALTLGGTPLAGATVRVWVKYAKTMSLTTTTGADGRFTLPALPTGSYEIDVVRGNYQVRWFGDSHSRTGAATINLTTTCTNTPDPTWGDPCATPVNIRMIKP